MSDNNLSATPPIIVSKEQGCTVELAKLDAAVAKAVQDAMSGFGDMSPELMKKVLSCVIDKNAVYPPNVFLFSIDGVPCINLGNIHTIGAKQKNGKTSLIELLAAASINGEWNRIKCLLPGIDILYIDTEMAPCDTLDVIHKIEILAGIDNLPDNIHLVNFRPLTSSEMKQGIPFLIHVFHPKLVIIDGIIDLCANFNDIEASQELVVNFLMKTALKYDCAIINVLHTNKTDGYSELRGHLGAFFEQKGTTVIKCEKDDDTNIVTVKFPTHRYAPLPEFHFTFDENGIPIPADTQAEEIEAQKRLDKKAKEEAEKQRIYAERVQAMVNILKKHDGCLERKVLTAELTKELKRSESTVKALFKQMLAEDKPVIVQTEGLIKLSE